MPLHIPTALNELMRDPESFLYRTPISIAGGGHGIQTYSLLTQPVLPGTTRPGQYLGRLNRKAVQEELLFMNGSLAGAIQVECYTVGMFNWGGAPNTVNIPAPAPSHPKLVVTGQLTDCTFTVAPDPAVPGGVICSHSRPIGMVGNALRGVVSGAAPANSTIFGPGGEYTNQVHTVSIVGVAKNGAWRFYQQRRERNGNLSVLKVGRIFP